MIDAIAIMILGGIVVIFCATLAMCIVFITPYLLIALAIGLVFLFIGAAAI